MNFYKVDATEYQEVLAEHQEALSILTYILEREDGYLMLNDYYAHCRYCYATAEREAFLSHDPHCPIARAQELLDATATS